MSETQNAEDVRRRIMDAALLLVARFGLKRTTLADIGSRAGLGKATLYYYFPDGKESIFAQSLRSIVEAIWDRVEAEVRRATSPTDQLLTYIRLRIDTFDREMLVRGMEQAIWEEIKPQAEAALLEYNRRERELLTEILERTVDDGLFRPHNIELGVRVLQAALKGLTFDGAVETTRAQRTRDVEEFLDFMCHGFLPR